MRRRFTNPSTIVTLMIALAGPAAVPVWAAPQAAATEAQELTPEQKDAAVIGVKWLALLDGEKYQDSWDKAGNTFRSEVKPEQWLAVLQRIRKPMGATVSRVPARVDMMKSMRGAPDGEYAVIHYTTGFKDKNITERLTLAKEEGKWEVFAYAIH
ncbi:MAG: DUF4019 domain-containing protein [Bryobacteraceae bacterium]